MGLVNDTSNDDMRAATAHEAERPVQYPLPLNSRYAGCLSPEHLDESLRRLFASTDFQVVADGRGVWLRGQNQAHHGADPDLAAQVAAMGMGNPRNIGAFRVRREEFALSFEDSWSGWFIAETLAALSAEESLVILHLDDHRDLMPTFLTRDGSGALSNPVTRTRFNASSQSDWEAAIDVGVVNIGNWLAAVVLGVQTASSLRSVHIRHLHPANGSSEPRPLCAMHTASVRSKLFPDQRFGLVSLKDLDRDPVKAQSTFHASPNVDDILDDLPVGRVLLHVDLDFFENHYNGNSRHGQNVSLAVSPSRTNERFVAFRQLLRNLTLFPADVVVASSPGFCASTRWTALVGEVEKTLKGEKAC